MKTLIFNGSPRKNGVSSNIISEITKKLTSEYEVISAYELNVSPCIDCRGCKKTDLCVINDNMQLIYNKILDAENIIIVSPIYFSTLTGPLLCMFSRLQLFFTSRFFNKSKKYITTPKLGALILTAGGSTKDFSSAISTASIILNEMNATLSSTLICTNTDNTLLKDNEIFLEKLNKLIETL